MNFEDYLQQPTARPHFTQSEMLAMCKQLEHHRETLRKLVTTDNIGRVYLCTDLTIEEVLREREPWLRLGQEGYSCRSQVCSMCAGTPMDCDMCGGSGQTCATHARSWTLCRDERDKP